MFVRCHKMSLTVLKIFYKKQRPNIVRYRNYRNFDNEHYMNDNKKKHITRILSKLIFIV